MTTLRSYNMFQKTFVWAVTFALVLFVGAAQEKKVVKDRAKDAFEELEKGSPL